MPSRASSTSEMTMRDAPLRRSAIAVSKPIGPAPMMTAESRT